MSTGRCWPSTCRPAPTPRHRRDAQKCVAPIAAAPASADEGRARSLRPTGRLSLRRVSGVRQRRRGRPKRRRESLCPHPAMPRHPHRRHAVHLIPPLCAGQFRGVADAPANAPHPDLFELERRGQRLDCLESLRAGSQAQSHLCDQRILTAERHQFPVGAGRRRARECRRNQEFQRSPRGVVSAARLRLAGQLSGDLSPLRRRTVAPPRRVYLKPHYLPADLPYWKAKQTGQL